MQYDSLEIGQTYNVQHSHGLVSTSELISNVLELKSQQSSKVLQHIMNVLFNVLVLLVVFHSIGNMMDRILNALYTVQVSSHTFICLIDITARSLRVLKLEFFLFLVSSCSSKTSTASNTYGNGLIKLSQKSFCSNIYSTNDSCDDVTVCKIIDDAREETFYVPLDRTDNISKE